MNSRLSLIIATFAMAAAAGDARAQDAQFEPPVEITHGGQTYLDVLYPSPVLHDMDGDGKSELVIGDLRGYLLYSQRSAVSSGAEWDAAQNVQDAAGKNIKFSNW